MREEAGKRTAVLGGKLLEHDERRLLQVREMTNIRSQYPGLRAARTRFLGLEMPFATRAAHHQRPHLQELRPNPPYRACQGLRPRSNTRKQILVEHEERLDCANLPALIPDHEIAILELRADRILHDLVIAAILPEMTEGARPKIKGCQLGAAYNGDLFVSFLLQKYGLFR